MVKHNTQVGDMITIEKHIKSTLSPHNDTAETSITTTIITKSYSDADLSRLPKKIAKRIETFKPRSSQLDREQLESAQDPFRGFFTLFWMAMGFYVIQTWSKNLQAAGILFDLSFFRLFSQDAITLIISDLVMVGSMFFSVILQKLIAMGWIRWRYTGMIIQHIFQVSFLFIPIYWTFVRNWPWVQSGFFILHTIAMLMKLHSYSFYNGELSGWSLCLSDLKKEYSNLAGELKKSDNDNDTEKQEHLNELKEKIGQVEGYLASPAKNISYPNNITFMNFVDFLLVPTLVYELEYPRTEKIRPSYVFEKIVATFGTFFLLYVNTEAYIIPVLPNITSSLYNSMLQMLFPFMVNYLLIFYIIFECICNVFAELTRFADRNFYDDWWNRYL
ncbi:MBOAT-domain-containing protein [Gigaspora margarita]|uniref:MBOAT-domain-containing protein n=1 Tax=Gigaspora margarita TaxID=4874 RepID=A0A8H4EJ90_GIGMA|nr:MBOAT-domain-containing protein [Gigaspora margarita]